MNPAVVVATTVGLVLASAFFVVVEFALLGSRRHRLEEAAGTSRSARAALRGVNELTVMLAGAQLGITACTFALGAVTKPAVDAWFSDLLGLTGMPGFVSGALAFGLSLVLVTFLHLVVGEMAPKSWAIAHPERSATIIGLPSRIVVWPFRPLLGWVNQVANRLVAATGVEPVERAAVGGRDAATIRHLVEHSAQVGTLEAAFREQIATAIDLQTLTAGALAEGRKPPTAVGASATVGEVHAAALRSGHLRVLVGRGPTGAEHPREVVHVRDTLLEPPERPARELAREALTVPADLPVHEALTRMRGASEQLALVVGPDDVPVGVITVSDVLARVLPGAEDVVVTPGAPA
ncbi:CNNM domain-containing protein [Pseudokineococcus sp. 1T1Z-3]|uniref:CNNM domain-containing protein n=1 Tax=Pseudokineococcus sp. 1T1Z-3 TaxID=3132745 RepID=UPI0030AAA6A2